MPAEDVETVNKAIARSGLPKGMWWRIVGLTAAGDETALGQLQAVATAMRGKKKTKA
jgi:hypothetical protein